MQGSVSFIPGFDEAHILKYFSNNIDAVKEMFMLACFSLEDDCNKLLQAVEDNDIASLTRAVHAMRPTFYMFGMHEKEQAVTKFYTTCLASTSIEAVLKEFMQLWPGLLHAQQLVVQQYQLFEPGEAAVF
jgi:hypothetical protein